MHIGNDPAPDVPTKDRVTNTIGLLSSGFPTRDIAFFPYGIGILAGVSAAAGESDYNVMLLTRSTWEDEESAPDWLAECPLDGLVWVSPGIHSHIMQGLIGMGIPIIGISSDSVTTGIPIVDVDNDLGGMLATDHLISLGHRRIAHLAGTVGQTSAFTRRDAFYRAMGLRGLEVPDDFVVQTKYYGDNAYVESIRLLSRPDRPTGMFCANDHIALEALRAALDLGISVPRELSIVGYDDVPLASQSKPPLTTVRQPFEDIGRFAANLLIQQMNGDAVEARQYLLPADLIVRESTTETSA